MDALMFPHLFSSIRIGPVELKNRVVYSPIGTRGEDGTGFVADRAVDYYVERARGGLGMIFFGDTDIEAGNPIATSLAKPEYIPKLAAMNDEIHFWGALVFAHLHYASADPINQVWKFELGEETEEIPTVSGESAEPGMKARQITIDEIEGIQDAYAEAAFRAWQADFDGVSINGGYGFLPSQFLSPRANKRTDKYGGDITGRARFLTEIIHKIRSKTAPDFPIIVKLSGDELRENGLKLEDTIAAAKKLEEEGLSAIFIVGGTQSKRDLHRVIPPMGTVPFGPFVPYAEAVKKAVNMPVIVGVRINDPAHAEEIIREGKADIVAIGRAAMAEPEWASKAREGRVDDIRKCIYCNRCLGDIWPAYIRDYRCAINAAAFKEREYHISPVMNPKKVMIIGGGPAGMEAARVARSRGHEVVLYEKTGKLGGQLLIACRAPHKEEINNLTTYLTTQINKLGVSVKLNTEVTPELVRDLKPDVVILATGAFPLVPAISGMDSGKVVNAWDVLADKTATGEKVIIAGGGLVGCEVAEYLLMKGKQVTIVEMLDDIAKDVEFCERIFLMERFASYKGLSVMTKAKVMGVSQTGVVVDMDGKSQEIVGDTVVLAMGAVSNNKLASELADPSLRCYQIGDCLSPHRILEAVHSGSYIARQI